MAVSTARSEQNGRYVAGTVRRPGQPSQIASRSLSTSENVARPDGFTHYHAGWLGAAPGGVAGRAGHRLARPLPPYLTLAMIWSAMLPKTLMNIEMSFASTVKPSDNSFSGWI